MNVCKILSPQLLKKLRLLIISRNLIRKSARIDLCIHDAVLSVYYIVIISSVKVNTALCMGERHRREHDILIPFSLRKSNTGQKLPSVQLIPRGVLDSIFLRLLHIIL